MNFFQKITNTSIENIHNKSVVITFIFYKNSKASVNKMLIYQINYVICIFVELFTGLEYVLLSPKPDHSTIIKRC